jgi:hypothetical protein
VSVKYSLLFHGYWGALFSGGKADGDHSPSSSTWVICHIKSVIQKWQFTYIALVMLRWEKFVVIGYYDRNETNIFVSSRTMFAKLISHCFIGNYFWMHFIDFFCMLKLFKMSVINVREVCI